MDWKSFITPIHESDIFKRNASKILMELFRIAGSAYNPNETTTRTWINGSRNCKVSTYFPSGESDVKTDSLYHSFRSKPERKLRQLQEMFREADLDKSDSPIDVGTDSLDIFCWSLVNQFLDLLGFQRINIPQ